LRELGVSREQRVLLVLDDTTAFPTLFLGALRISAVPVPVSPLDKDDNFRHFVDDSYAEVVAADADVFERLRAALGGRQVRWLFGVLVRHPDADGALDSVRFSVSAAEPLPPTTLQRWRERFGHPIVDGIGSTEMLHIYCSNRPDDVQPGTSGWPVPGYDLRLID